MNLDLNEIYDKGVNDPPEGVPIQSTSKPVQSPAPTPSIEEALNIARGSTGAENSLYKASDYIGYLPNGVYTGKGDLDAQRGEAQSGWDKLGNFAVQTIGKTLTGFTEGLGYMGTLATQWGDDRNYENSLTAASKGANDWLDKNFPLYRHNNDTWALNDASWWYQNAQGIISSVAAFGGEGYLFSALAKGLKIGEGVEALANFGKKVNKVTGALEGESLAGTLANAHKIGEKSSKLFTAGMLAYTEGAMAGKRIYDNVYQAQLAQALKDGKSFEEADDWARHQGSQAAATGVQLNTMVNTAFGFMGGVGEFFNHEKNAVISAAKKNLFMTAAEADLGAEALPTFLKRLGTETAEKLKLGTHKSWGTVAKEAVAEGMEELTNNWAENTATEHGKKGENLGFIEQLGTLKDYFTTKGVLDADGALNFVMGAVLGPIQHGVASHLPMHRQITGTETKIVDGKEVMVDKDGEATDDYEKAKKKYLPGKFGTNLVTSRQLNEFGANEYFKDVKAGIEADYKKMSDIQASIKESIADGNFIRAEQFRKELFNASNTNAVAMGFAGNLVDTYRSFKNVDNTKTAKVEAQEQVDGLTNAVQQAKDQGQDTTELEAQLAAAQTKLSTASNKTAAMELNLTDGIDNNDYKDMADKAIEHLENLQKIHDGVLHKYGSPDNNTNMVQGHVSNQIFNKLGNLYLMREDEKVLQKELDEADNSVASNLLGDVDNSADLEVYSKRVSRLKDAHENILGKLDRIATAIKSNKYSDVMDLIKEHGANGVTEADAPKAIKELQNKLLDQQDKLAEDYKGETENLVNTPMYEKWAIKNPKKNFDDFLTQVIKERRDSAFQRQTSLELENLRSRIKTHEEFVREIQESKTLASIKAKTERNFKNLQKELDAEKLATLKNKEARKQAEVARRDYNIKLMKELQVRYKKEMTNLTVEKNTLVSDLKELAGKLKNFKYDLFSDNAAEFEALINKKAELETKLERIQNRVTTLQTLWNEAAEIIVESSQPVEENPVVAEPTTEPITEDEYFVEDEPVEPDEAVTPVVKDKIVGSVGVGGDGNTRLRTEDEVNRIKQRNQKLIDNNNKIIELTGKDNAGESLDVLGEIYRRKVDEANANAKKRFKEGMSIEEKDKIVDDEFEKSGVGEVNRLITHLNDSNDTNTFKTTSLSQESKDIQKESDEAHTKKVRIKAVEQSLKETPQTIRDIGVSNITVAATLGRGKGLMTLIDNGKPAPNKQNWKDIRDASKTIDENNLKIVQQGDTLIVAIGDSNFEFRGGFIALNLKGKTEGDVDLEQLKNVLLDIRAMAEEKVGGKTNYNMQEIQENILNILKSYEKQTPTPQETETTTSDTKAKKADIERRRQEGTNLRGTTYKGETTEKDGLKITKYSEFRPDGKRISKGGRIMTPAEFIKEYNITDQDYLDSLEGATEIRIYEVRTGKDRTGISILATFPEGNIEMEVAGAELADIETDPVEETPPVEPTDTPKQDYFMSILKSSTTPSLLMEVYNELEEGKKVSLNALDNADLGKLTSPQVVTAIHEALTELGYVLADLEDLEQKAENIDTSFEDDGADLDVTDVEPEPEPPVTTKQVSDGFETNNPAPDEIDRVQAQASWSGRIQESPADSMAVYTFLERTVSNEVTGDKRQERLGELNPELHPDIVDPTQLLPGTPVTLTIDVDFEGTADLPAFSSYLDDAFHIRTDDKTIGEVPIKIMGPNGKVSYVHIVGWIAEEIPGSSSDNRFRNCRTVIYDENGLVISSNNVEKEVEKVMKLRRVLVQNYNAGLKSGVKSVVESKGPGTIPYLKEYSSAAANLPTVKLGVVAGDGVFKGIGHEKINMPKDMSKWDGRTVALIPMNNGTFTPLTLQGKLLKDCKNAFSTLVRITEIHLDPKATGRNEEAEQIKTATGFDVRTLAGYRNFVIQYFTHLNAETQLNNVKSGIIFDVVKGQKGETTSRIVIARKDEGAKQSSGVVAALKDGALNPEFRSELKALIEKRYKTTALEVSDRGIKGINSEGKFNEILYDSNTKKWETNSATSYTDYIKAFLFSNAKSQGVLKSSDGKSFHVFAGNPIIKYSHNIASAVEYNPKLAMEDTTNVAALNAVNGTNNPVSVVGTQADQAPVTFKDVEKVYDKLYNDLCEAGDYDAADALKSPSNTWDKYRTTITHDMIESKIKCG